MATIDYKSRLENLQNRKFDRELNESLISKSFSDTELPENVKYLVETMQPIDEKYNARTIDAANRVKRHLEDGLDLHFNRAYRTQGSVMTSTNIRAHSDFDLLSVIDRYFYPEVSNGNHYTASDPLDDIIDFRSQATRILKNIYDEVDVGGDKCITVINKSLNRKVDIVFAYWYESVKYHETNDEYYKGVHLFNFPARQKEAADFPFATIRNVNQKGISTRDGSKMGIRLLKNLKADGDIDLSSFHITSAVHSINDPALLHVTGNELQIAQAISAQLERIISDPFYRKTVQSPNGTERPFYSDEVVPRLEQLKSELDTLIGDVSKEILLSPVIRKAILQY